MTTVGAAKTRLSKRDQRTVVKLVGENAEELAKTETPVLLRLKTNIERVTLKELIEKFEEKLSRTLKEPQWQSFFEANPFILSMAFAVPAILLQGNPYVGGARFDGSGGGNIRFSVSHGIDRQYCNY